jgi:hypothetical protein
MNCTFPCAMLRLYVGAHVCMVCRWVGRKFDKCIYVCMYARCMCECTDACAHMQDEFACMLVFNTVENGHAASRKKVRR